VTPTPSPHLAIIGLPSDTAAECRCGPRTSPRAGASRAGSDSRTEAATAPVLHRHRQRRLWRRAAAVVPPQSRDRCRPTRPRDARSVGILDPHHDLVPLCRLQAFLRTVSVRMLLSSVRSATRRFSFAFSWLSCLNSRSSVMPRFACRCLQTWNAASLIRSYRHTSATAVPGLRLPERIGNPLVAKPPSLQGPLSRPEDF
jgi:hypothetical protein